MTRPPSADAQTYVEDDPVNRSERRARADRYQRIDIGPVACRTCGANLGATFVIEKGEPAPALTFVHLADGGHEPIIAGNGMAARARRDGRVIGQSAGELR